METVVVVAGWVGHVGNPQGVVQALCEQGVVQALCEQGVMSLPALGSCGSERCQGFLSVLDLHVQEIAE
jgi:hypothetical protein